MCAVFRLKSVQTFCIFGIISGIFYNIFLDNEYVSLISISIIFSTIILTIALILISLIVCMDYGSKNNGSNFILYGFILFPTFVIILYILSFLLGNWLTYQFFMIFDQHILQVASH
jgi:hypothetical protein